MRNAGQAVLEFLGSLLCFSYLWSLAVLVCVSQWDRLRCSYGTFQAVHSRLFYMQKDVRWNGKYFYSNFKKNGQSFSVQIFENEARVLGIGRCGRHIERVELPKLEAAVWQK